MDITDFSYIETLYMHPGIWDEIKRFFREEDKKYYIESKDFRTIQGIKVITSEIFDKFRDVEYWERTDILPDTKLVKWVTDIENPPSWAIYFGLVKKATKQEWAIYAKTKKSPFFTALRY